MLQRLAITSALVLAASQASAVTINFDDLATGSTLSNQYAGLGVTFSPNAFSGPGSSGSGQPWASNTDMTLASVTGGAADVGALGSPSLVSGNVLHRYNNWLGEDGDPSFLINFSTPVTSVSLDFAGVSGNLYAPDSRLFIYNGSTLLAEVGATLPSSSVAQLTLSYAAASITSVAVAMGSYDDWVAVDNLVFAPVPEPGTYGLMALGLLAVVGAAQRRGKR
ncbi:MAG: PEP-CTERM sorting domain-containing protein [Rubrivivax sp.]|nr:PEP-CTERM sorting domain-containing protein [Rubrivivax sp.]